MKQLNAIHNQGYTQALLDIQSVMKCLGKRLTFYYGQGPEASRKTVTGYDATMAILKLLLSDGYARGRFKDAGGNEVVWLRLEGGGRKRKIVAFLKDDPRRDVAGICGSARAAERASTAVRDGLGCGGRGIPALPWG